MTKVCCITGYAAVQAIKQSILETAWQPDMEPRWMQTAFQIQTSKIGLWILAWMNRRLQYFPSFAVGLSETSAFGTERGPLRRMESNKAFKWNNYLNVAHHQVSHSRFVMAPLGPIEMCRVDLCARWEMHSNTTDNLEQTNNSVVCLRQRRESALHVHSWYTTSQRFGHTLWL